MDPGTTVGNLGVWQVTLRPTQQLFANGQYAINNVGRAATAGCANQLADAACNQGAGVAMGLTGKLAGVQSPVSACLSYIASA